MCKKAHQAARQAHHGLAARISGAALGVFYSSHSGLGEHIHEIECSDEVCAVCWVATCSREYTRQDAKHATGDESCPGTLKEHATRFMLLVDGMPASHLPF